MPDQSWGGATQSRTEPIGSRTGVSHRQDEASLTVYRGRGRDNPRNSSKKFLAVACGVVRLELARSSEDVEATPSPRSSVTIGLGASGRRLALREVYRSHRLTLYKVNEINDVRGLTAAFPAVTVVWGSKAGPWRGTARADHDLQTGSAENAHSWLT